jgi:hypothetical protein
VKNCRHVFQGTETISPCTAVRLSWFRCVWTCVAHWLCLVNLYSHSRLWYCEELGSSFFNPSRQREKVGHDLAKQQARHRDNDSIAGSSLSNKGQTFSSFHTRSLAAWILNIWMRFQDRLLFSRSGHPQSGTAISQSTTGGEVGTRRSNI